MAGPDGLRTVRAPGFIAKVCSTPTVPWSIPFAEVIAPPPESYASILLSRALVAASLLSFQAKRLLQNFNSDFQLLLP